MLWQAATIQPAPDGMAGGMTASADGLTMGMTAPLFLAIWVVMMAAMMLPSAAPMILMFDAIQAQRSRGGRKTVPTGAFVGGYLVVWAAFGVVAYAGALMIGAVSDLWPDLALIAPRIGGAVIVAAGIYQLTALKQACLREVSDADPVRPYLVARWCRGSVPDGSRSTGSTVSAAAGYCSSSSSRSGS